MIVRFGYTPDTDDAFHYFALESGLAGALAGIAFEFHRHPVQTLNEMALRGELEISAISSILYPRIESRYVVLSSGSSVGRGYGPVLGARKGAAAVGSLEGKKVAVPGRFTTGYFLLSYFYNGFEPVFMAFDAIAGAIESGQVDAGVLIHEELLNYQFRNIEKIACLGQRWFGETGLPLPVGLSVARRDLGRAAIGRLKMSLEASMRYAMRHPDQAMAFAAGFSSGRGEVTEEFISKFANHDTENMPADVRMGLRELFGRAHRRGLIPNEPNLEIV